MKNREVLTNGKGIIAFCGSKGSGKSTSYEIFKNMYTDEIEELALAGHLKEVCSKVFNIDMKYFLDPKLKEVELENYVILTKPSIEAVLKNFNVSDFDYDKHIRPHVGQVFETPRRVLQYVGTEILHPIDPLIHAKFVLNKKDCNKLTVVTDLRFVAEFDFLNKSLSNNFIPVYVKNSKAELEASTDAHPSERELSLFKDKCYKLNNETSLSDLENRINVLLKDMFKGNSDVEKNTRSV